MSTPHVPGLSSMRHIEDRNIALAVWYVESAKATTDRAAAFRWLGMAAQYRRYAAIAKATGSTQ